MKPKFLLLFFIPLSMILCLSSCKPSDVLFEEFKKTEGDLEWKNSDRITINVPIKQNAHPYRFYIGLRYASGFRYEKMSIRMTEKDPEGTETKYDIDIPVRDEKGEFIGEKGYDIIDLEYLFNAKKNFPVHGNYIYTFEPNMPGVDKVDFIMEVGVIIKEKENSENS